MRKLFAAAAILALAIGFCAPASAQFSGQSNVTPRDCSGTITTGGTAQVLVKSSALRGLQVTNLDTTEVMWFSLTGTAAAATAGSYMLQAASATVPGGSYSTPLGFGPNSAISIIAATTGHKFSCTWW